MNIEAFINETNQALMDFRKAYYAEHMENPEHYPLTLEEDNSGLWLEFFLQYLSGESV